MSIVKPLPESDIEKYVTITANAYPGFHLDSDEDRNRDAKRLKTTYAESWRTIYGLYRREQLLGGMIYLDFDMTFESTRLPAGGVGRVAVDLAHKKEKVARDMMSAFIEHYREREVPLLLLYPFRPDFYHRMGFGYGTKMSHYRFRPDSLVTGGEKAKVRILEPSDKTEVLSCYNRFAERTHGMILRNGPELNYHFEQPTSLFVGYSGDDNLLGYMLLKFELGETFLENDLQIIEAIAENRQALLGLLAFIRSQLDQVAWISYATHDESFQFLLSDPRNDSGRIIPPVYHESNSQGVGLMYRVIDIPGLFSCLANHRFGNHDLRLRLSVSDSFLPENDMAISLSFDAGRARIVDPRADDVEISMAIPEFSSMIVGAVRFSELFNYGLADISDENCLEMVDSLFKHENKPICLSRF
ncbi:MAG TPA: GNAT family N-acetyltransferase [candidate division Zixibacteria bacterium]|nr:GNAT family N-acetyltransferase [candidate division Zixibacteria bacterium]